MKLKLHHLLSAIAILPGGPPTAAAEVDVFAVLDCVDAATFTLHDGCACADVLSFCAGDAVPLAGAVPGLAEACGSAPACCVEGVDAAAFNSCWRENGFADIVVDLDALIAEAMPEPVVFPAGDAAGGGLGLGGGDECMNELIQWMDSDDGNPAGLLECCEEGDYPFCEMVGCLDPITGDPSEAKGCDCQVMVDVFTDESLPFFQLGGQMLDFVNMCCTPGETTLVEASQCLETGGTIRPAICDQDPTLDVCTCLSEPWGEGEGLILDDSCECGVMLDLMSEEPSWGLRFGTSDVADIKACCVRGEKTIGEASFCIYQSMDCTNAVGQVMEMPGFDTCCTPGTSLVDASACAAYQSQLGGEGGEGLDDFFGGGVFGAGLTCWHNDPQSGFGYSLGGNDACASFCWDCAMSSPDDTLCTDEQRADGTKVSLNLGLLKDSVELYEMTYAGYGFSSCDIDDCNMVDACTGEPMEGGEYDFFGGGGFGAGISCWHNDPQSGFGYSLGGNDACASFCWDCAMSSPDDTLCTDDQRADGTKVSMNLGLPKDSVEMYEMTYASYGFSSCDTDDCNMVNACTGELMEGGAGLGGFFGGGFSEVKGCHSSIDLGYCCEENPGDLFCEYYACIDQATGEYSPDCDCTVLNNLYTNPESPMHIPLFMSEIDSCCVPDETTLLEFEECVNSTTSDIDSIDCGVVLDMFNDESLLGGVVGIFLDMVDLESCCIRGQTTMAEMQECIGEEGADLLGGFFGTPSPVGSPVAIDLLDGDKKDQLVTDPTEAPPASKEVPADDIQDAIEQDTTTSASTEAPPASKEVPADDNQDAIEQDTTTSATSVSGTPVSQPVEPGPTPSSSPPAASPVPPTPPDSDAVDFSSSEEPENGSSSVGATVAALVVASAMIFV